MVDFKYCKDSFAIQTHRIFPLDLNTYGFLFGGKLMTLIDDTASISISRHCRRAAVTGSLEELNFLNPLHSNHSVCVESYVSGAHRKSMEVFVKVIGENLMTGDRYLAATCFINFVAIADSEHPDKDFVVPQVQPQSEEEKLICDGYPARRAERLAKRTDYKEFIEKLSIALPWEAEA
ncbi:acyl-CoA thioesterase [Enterococcus alishanensis]|uniref:Acyl-CoA thioesterase n=1 Tax=Enterococcus alishanensis TaxID=1303817 RepID=A0ABS6TCV1_9ENTE|nr:acyl-CoA thioesterase [Enterococcus alishanensis]MBV7390730.1 acyl-CoA thioesterase [Enterococcus alishanensis]